MSVTCNVTDWNSQTDVNQKWDSPDGFTKIRTALSQYNSVCVYGTSGTDGESSGVYNIYNFPGTSQLCNQPIVIGSGKSLTLSTDIKCLGSDVENTDPFIIINGGSLTVYKKLYYQCKDNTTPVIKVNSPFSTPKKTIYLPDSNSILSACSAEGLLISSSYNGIVCSREGNQCVTKLIGTLVSEATSIIKLEYEGFREYLILYVTSGCLEKITGDTGYHSGLSNSWQDDGFNIALPYAYQVGGVE